MQFTQATARDFPGDDFDLVCFFDCLHDMGDPVGAARHAHEVLKPGGAVLLVEPFANDDLDENLNPVGRMYYAASTCICTPNSLSQEVGLGLGAQAGERRLRHVFAEAGFASFRRATETPFNLVLEARSRWPRRLAALCGCGSSPKLCKHCLDHQPLQVGGDNVDPTRETAGREPQQLAGPDAPGRRLMACHSAGESTTSRSSTRRPASDPSATFARRD